MRLVEFNNVSHPRTMTIEFTVGECAALRDILEDADAAHILDDQQEWVADGIMSDLIGGISMVNRYEDA